MIAITGANGQLGQLVIAELLKRTNADQIIALVRSPEKAEAFKAQGIQVRKADYNQADTLVSALQGVDKLLLISGSEIGQRATQHQAVIDAAKEASVGFLAYTSLLKTDSSKMILSQEHKVTELAIKDSGLPATILRNGWYNENYTGNIAAVLEHKAVVGAGGEGKITPASRRDYAEAAAVVLASSHDHIGKVYELAGDQAFTQADYAAEIARQTGEQIAYQALSESDYSAMLEQIGLPQGFANILADSDALMIEGALFDDSHTLSQLIGRPTTMIQDSIKAALVS
jgi:NAD(P)H dehydrogenase (quinone)